MRSQESGISNRGWPTLYTNSFTPISFTPSSQRTIDMIKRILGTLAFLLGAAILGWVGYNYFIEMQPQAKGRNPIPALVFSTLAILLGLSWMRTKKE